ncbi:MAG: hypothetical protein J0M12_14915, partial [Deltaproteobacteria bacterium]|nr:hypothetical protein [Deltaproteobacteria bacterium]
VHTATATDIEQTCVAILSRLTTTTLSRIKLHLANELAVEDDRKAESAALHRDLSARGASKAERSAIFTAQKERYAATAAKIQRALYADYAKLEFLWSTFAPTSYFELAQRGHSVSDARRIKFIYSIGHDGIPLLSPELPSKLRDRRETHSQQLSGRNMFAGGELVLAQHDQLFHSIGAWRGFDTWLRGQTEPLPWSARELNNSTGHYLVLSDTLAYASAILYPALEKVGIATDRCETVDRLLPGLRIRGAGLYRFT